MRTLYAFTSEQGHVGYTDTRYPDLLPRLKGGWQFARRIDIEPGNEDVTTQRIQREIAEAGFSLWRSRESRLL